MTSKTSAEDVISCLNLQPLPVEGGFFRETYRDSGMSNIYYLITDDSFSSLHSLRATEVWHFYAGTPAQMIQISPSGILEKFTLGSDIKNGQLPQVRVLPHYYQGTRLNHKGGWALFGCTVAPAFEAAHFTHGQRCEIIKKFPYLFDIITRYSVS